MSVKACRSVRNSRCRCAKDLPRVLPRRRAPERDLSMREPARGVQQNELNRRCWGGVSDGGMDHLQMADSEAPNSHAKGQSTRDQGEKNERAHSHTMASTSPRCGLF